MSRTEEQIKSHGLFDEYIHASHINSMISCGRAFEMRYIKGERSTNKTSDAINFGNILHHYAHEYHMGNNLDFDEDVIRRWSIENNCKVDDKHYPTISKLFFEYCGNQDGMGVSLGSEISFWFEYDGIKFEGSIDRIRALGSTLVIEDLKTSGATSGKFTKHSDMYLTMHPQMNMYGMALIQIRAGNGEFVCPDPIRQRLMRALESSEVGKFRLYMLSALHRYVKGPKTGKYKGDPDNSVSVTERQIINNFNDMNMVYARRIMNQEFAPAPRIFFGGDNCNGCGYQSQCKMSGEIKGLTVPDFMKEDNNE